MTSAVTTLARTALECYPTTAVFSPALATTADVTPWTARRPARRTEQPAREPVRLV